MAGELTHEELSELLGAYALDAVDDAERRAIEEFLTVDPRARAEVAAYRETASFLAHGGSDAPSGLWDRIEGALEETPPPLVLPLPRPSHRGLRVATALGIAAALVAFVALGAKVISQDDRIDRPPDTQALTLTSPGGGLHAELIVLGDGRGYLLDDNLEALPPGQVYQLWALTGKDPDAPKVVSAGVLGNDPGVTPFTFDGKLHGFVVTEEIAPGVEQSENPPLLEGRLD